MAGRPWRKLADAAALRIVSLTYPSDRGGREYVWRGIHAAWPDEIPQGTELLAPNSI